MEKQPGDPSLESEIERAVREVEENLHVGPETARVIAEDEILGGVPSHSSEAVEDERLRRVQDDPKG